MFHDGKANSKSELKKKCLKEQSTERKVYLGNSECRGIIH